MRREDNLRFTARDGAGKLGQRHWPQAKAQAFSVGGKIVIGDNSGFGEIQDNPRRVGAKLSLPDVMNRAPCKC